MRQAVTSKVYYPANRFLTNIGFIPLRQEPFQQKSSKKELQLKNYLFSASMKRYLVSNMVGQNATGIAVA